MDESLAGIEIVTADMASPESLEKALNGVEKAMLISSSAEAMQEVFGLKPTGFLEFAQRHAAIFRGEEAPPKI